MGAKCVYRDRLRGPASNGRDRFQHCRRSFVGRDGTDCVVGAIDYPSLWSTVRLRLRHGSSASYIVGRLGHDVGRDWIIDCDITRWLGLRLRPMTECLPALRWGADVRPRSGRTIVKKADRLPLFIVVPALPRRGHRDMPGKAANPRGEQSHTRRPRSLFVSVDTIPFITGHHDNAATCCSALAGSRSER